MQREKDSPNCSMTMYEGDLIGPYRKGCAEHAIGLTTAPLEWTGGRVRCEGLVWLKLLNGQNQAEVGFGTALSGNPKFNNRQNSNIC